MHLSLDTITETGVTVVIHLEMGQIETNLQQLQLWCQCLTPVEIGRGVICGSIVNKNHLGY